MDNTHESLSEGKFCVVRTWAMGYGLWAMGYGLWAMGYACHFV